MGAIVEFRVQSDAFAMTESLQAVSGMKLDVVQEAGTDPERPLLLFWAHGGDLEAFELALEADETVTDIERYSSFRNQSLYRVQNTDHVELVPYPIWVELGAEQIDVRYRDGWWHAKFRVPDQDALVRMEEWCDEHDVAFELSGVYSLENGGRGPPELTAEQREALQTALEMGYFEVPREGTLADVAEQLDISSQAASERLRRAYKQLVQEHL